MHFLFFVYFCIIIIIIIIIILLLAYVTLVIHVMESCFIGCSEILCKSLYLGLESGSKWWTHTDWNHFVLENSCSTYVILRSSGNICIYFFNNLTQCVNGNGLKPISVGKFNHQKWDNFYVYLLENLVLYIWSLPLLSSLAFRCSSYKEASHHNFLCLRATCQALDITIHNSFYISVTYFMLLFFHFSTQYFLSSLFFWSTWHSVNLFVFYLSVVCKSLNDTKTFLSSWICTKLVKITLFLHWNRFDQLA